MKKSFAYPYGVWLAVFILAPILMVVVYAFHNADGGFTLHNFSYLPGYLPIFGRSFWLSCQQWCASCSATRWRI